jgi:aryl-alcohol dehydrogenase-like predicted oxidoreductase
MHATAEGTVTYAGRFPEFRDAGFYRTVFGLRVSSLGIGTYLGAASDAADAAYTEALVAAGRQGINFFDCAINYRNQRSERSMGAALRQLRREEMVVATKAGFLTPGAVPGFLQQKDVAGGMHSMDPDFLEDQIERSLVNLGIDTLDIFYLHNPETQLDFVSREVFEERIAGAFGRLERLVAAGKIRRYGTATWDGYRVPGQLSLPRLAEIAQREGGAEHHFHVIQLPFNLAMTEAFAGEPESVLDSAARLGIAVVASGTLMQGKLARGLPHPPRGATQDLDTHAQRAIQFTRSTPGIAVALVGMGRPEHVAENLAIARVSPLDLDSYLVLYPRSG